MARPMILIALLLVMPSCQSHTWLLYANPPVGDDKQGQECSPVIFALGPSVDLSGNGAMSRGGITKVKTVEYQMNSFHGLGKECIIAHGE
jgi:TRL (tRNA-associated locus)-like protein